MKREHVNDLIAGFAAGVTGTVVGHPLDVIKTTIQGQDPVNPIYRSSFDCARQLYKGEGYRSFFKGLLPPLVNIAVLNTVGFGLFSGLKRKVAETRYNYEHSKGKIADLHGHSQQKLISHPLDSVAIGMLVGLGSSFFATPFDQVKIQTQMKRRSIGTNARIGSVKIASKIWKNYGFFRGFYNGFVVNTVREILFGAVYFGSYENTKEYLLIKNRDTNLMNWSIPFAGGSAGALAWFFSFPLDVVRTQIMSQPPPQSNQTKINSFKLMRELFRKSGFSVFYRGVTASVLRAFIVSAVRFTSFELALHYLPKS